MQSGEVYRCIKPVDLAPIFSILDGLKFFRAGQTGKYPCDVVVPPLPKEVETFIESLGLGGHRARAVFRRSAHAWTIRSPALS